MGWKELPAWVRGGIWAIAIYVLITLILLPFGKPAPCIDYFCMDYGFKPTFYASIPLAYFFYTIIGWDFPLIFYYLYAVLTCFVVGTLIGWIVGKVKGRKAVIAQ